jgi:hypothetical protein
MSKIAKEVAEAEFNRFIEANDILIDDAMEKEDRDAFNEQKARILRAIEFGAMVINEDGEPVYTPQRTKDAEPLTFHEPTGASLMAMDRKKRNEDVGKLYATMGDMTRTDAKTFSSLRMADLKVCMAVAALFLG